MDFLGIGPLEIVLILVVALIVLGPKDMVKAGRSIGQFLRKIVTSQGWQAFRQASRDLRHLPNTLIREAGLEETAEDLKKLSPSGLKEDLDKEMQQVKDGMKSWTTFPTIAPNPEEPTSPSEEPTSPPQETPPPEEPNNQ
jgi:sec-independent protein translocase protein TatB